MCVDDVKRLNVKRKQLIGNDLSQLDWIYICVMYADECADEKPFLVSLRSLHFVAAPIFNPKTSYAF